MEKIKANVERDQNCTKINIMKKMKGRIIRQTESLFIELNACSGRIIQHHNDNRKSFYPKSIQLLRILPLTISLQFFLDFLLVINFSHYSLQKKLNFTKEKRTEQKREWAERNFKMFLYQHLTEVDIYKRGNIFFVCQFFS